MDFYRNNETLAKIRNVMRGALAHPADFYRQKYGIGDTGNDFSWADFENTPPMTRDEIARFDWSFLQDPQALFFMSSGTTQGAPLYSWHKQWLLEENLVPFLESKPVRHLLLLREMMNGQGILLRGITIAQQIGAHPLVADASHIDGAAILVRDFHPEYVMTTPTLARLLAEKLEALGIKNTVQLLCLNAEPLTRTYAKFIDGLYPHARKFISYGMSEVGANTANNMQGCPSMGESLSPIYHMDTEKLFAEISERGELIITHLFDSYRPLIRYATGDKVEVMEARPRCGGSACPFRGPTIVCRGRVDGQSLKFGGFQFRAAILNAGLARRGIFIPYWRLDVGGEVGENAFLPTLSFYYNGTSGEERNEEISAALADEFRIGKRYKLGEAQRENLIKLKTVTRESAVYGQSIILCDE